MPRDRHLDGDHRVRVGFPAARVLLPFYHRGYIGALLHHFFFGRLRRPGDFYQIMGIFRSKYASFTIFAALRAAEESFTILREFCAYAHFTILRPNRPTFTVP